MKWLGLLIFIGFHFCIALEFGSMGNTPASVGGAGVAYKKNSWALFYNPAILGVNRKYNIAYSFGVGYGENNLAQLADIDYKNIQNLPDTVAKLAESKSILRAASSVSSRNYSDLGLISDVLKNVTNSTFTSGITDTSSLKSYIDTITGQSGSDIDDSINKLKNLSADEKLSKFTQIKNDLSSAIDKVGASGSDVGILKSIIDNLDTNKIDGLVESIKNGSSINISNLLNAIGGITINRGANNSIDRLLDDYIIIDKSLQSNSLKIHSNNGFVFHIGGNKERGAIGFGVLASVYGFMNLEMDKTHNRIIVNSSNNYYEIGINDNDISLYSSTADSYNNYSILSPNAKHTLYSNNIALIEVPIAYGHTIPFVAGDFHIGATLKYIHAISAYSNQTLNLENLKFNFDLKDKIKQTNTFGIDIGGLYTIDWFSLGFVGKNLNAPKIKTSSGKMRLDSQFRTGVGFEIWRFTILADIDILPNSTLDPNKKNQMVGGGVIFDASWLDFRLGAMGDLRANPYGTIITAGMNIVNFIDISVQSSLITKDIENYKLPNYLDIRIGGRFLF
ncbi:hypothetical protein CCY99_05315 [Helicobacter sp. 16-1353]|uniref:conjugal transfer protein TraF n=1 Tax=Helicobacter sp. 16-1353 TaxID=2004996 RepID=UPI000DCDB4FE|nr:conjugal transfer protein TraF [Helicobacter sp. 16-1353]RAX54099.1 hypothetical protein CCY99_05315 [Helicobacter sp. 16-1353]